MRFFLRKERRMNINVTAGPHTYRNCPVQAQMPVENLGYGEASLVDGDGARLRCQLFHDQGGDCVAWIEPELKPRVCKSYRLETSASAGGSGVEIEDAGGGKLEVRIGGRLFTRYHYGEEWARPFLYPFVGPRETAVTRSYPMRSDIPGEKHDHPHHRSVWVAYGEVNGTDNWSEQPGHAYIRHRAFDEVSGGPVFGRIRSRNNWVNSAGAKQMEDVREFTFYNLADERIVDARITFVATDGDVLLSDTKEGGVMSVRVATSMDGDKGGTITNSFGGITEAETWGKPAHWVDYCGPVDGRTMGITIMDHPSSFRHPTRWHVRDYGLFTANPFALKYYEPDKGWNGDHTIKNGDSLCFQYRIYVHEGNTQEAEVAERYFGFVAPPQAAVK